MASPNGSESGAFELTPIGPNRFVILGTPIVAEFVPPTLGKPQEIHVTGAGPKPTISQLITTSFTPSSAVALAEGRLPAIVIRPRIWRDHLLGWHRLYRLPLVHALATPAADGRECREPPVISARPRQEQILARAAARRRS